MAIESHFPIFPEIWKFKELTQRRMFSQGRSQDVNSLLGSEPLHFAAILAPLTLETPPLASPPGMWREAESVGRNLLGWFV